MQKIAFCSWDAIAARKDGKKLTITDLVILCRSHLTHTELRFGKKRGGVSWSSTMVDHANGCRFKYINYSHPQRWSIVEIEIPDEVEETIWQECCRMADMPAKWRTIPWPVAMNFFIEYIEGKAMKTRNKNIAIYQGPRHIQYDLTGLLSFALQQSGKWWLTKLRHIIWAWCALPVFKPDPTNVWCSEACATAWNKGWLNSSFVLDTNLWIRPQELSPAQLDKQAKKIQQHMEATCTRI